MLMKRLTLPLLAALLAFAAEPARAQTGIGIRGSLNYSTADIAGDVFTGKADAILGWHAGLVGEVEISRYFAVQTAAFYSRKGFDVEDSAVEVRVDYVEIPVMWIFKYPGKIEPRLQLGAVLGLETSCRLTSTALSDQPCQEQTVLSIDTKGADTGVIFGAGVKFPFGPGSALLDVFYNLGLTNVVQINDDVDSIKNRTLYLSAGYLFTFGNITTQ